MSLNYVRGPFRGGALLAGLLIVFLSGCSSSSDWFSRNDDSPLPPPLEAGADGVVPDNTGRKDEETAETAEAAEGEQPADPAAVEAADGEAAIPPAPQRQLANALISDKDKAKHSEEELRGGRVAPVAPPRPAPPAPPKPPRAENTESLESPIPATEQAPPAMPQGRVSDAPLGTPQSLEQSLAAKSSPSPAPAASPVQATPPRSPQLSRLIPPAGSNAQLRPRGAPSVTAAPIPAPIPVSPAALGSQPGTAYPGATFQPSHAQPLPPEVLANLPPGVAERYRETGGTTVIGGRPQTGGSGQAYAIIPFASGSTRLSEADLRTIRMAANMHMTQRGNRVRVVGHASSSTSSRSASEQLIANWEISQARANAVADALIADGIPPGSILIEAVGDGQPALDSSDMEADAANRRVDIYLE